MSNVVIYARYSSAKQREESIEGQIRVCREYAQNHDMTVIREYSDRAESGLSFETRENAMQMIKDSERHNFTAILVYKLDRFTRDNYDFYKYQKQLQKNGVDIISVTENFGEGAQGEFMLGIQTAYNHYYSKELGEKAARGMTENINHGHSNGSYRKYGYDIKDKKYVINPEEANVVREIFEKYANGERIKGIIESLNMRGIRTARNKPFSNDYISRILQNIIYTGVLRWNSIEFQGGIEPIISKELFEKAQKRLEVNKKTGATANAKEPYALVGKLFCGKCGQPMVADSVNKSIKVKKPDSYASDVVMSYSMGSFDLISSSLRNPVYSPVQDTIENKTYRYYVCRGQKNKSYINGCDKKRVDKDLVEKRVVEFTALNYLSDDNIERLSKATLKLQKKNPSLEEIKQLKVHISKEQTKIDNLLKMVEEGYGEKVTYERIREADARKNDYIKSMNEIKERYSPEASLEELKKTLYELRDKMNAFVCNGNVPQNVIKNFIDIFVSKVYIYDEDDDGPPRLKIIFDELETADLSGFNEADIPLGSTINIAGSPKLSQK